MTTTVFFLGLIIGPFVGWLAALIADNSYRESEYDRAVIFLGGILGWFGSAVVALCVSAFVVYKGFPEQTSMSLFGVQVYGVIFCAWVASMAGAVVSIAASKILRR